MSEEPTYIAQDDSELNVIFIHSKLDDIGLSANQFRIFAHLSRRAHSAGKAWPGVDSMATVCRMHKETVIACLRELETLGMIVIERTPGKRSVYRLTAPSKWQPVGNGERSEPGNGSGRNGGTPPVGNGERKEIHSRKSTKEAAGAAESESSIESKVALPPELDSDEFLAAINLWVSERSKRRIKPYTPTGFRHLLAELVKIGQARAIAAIHFSITQGYQGIFESHEAKKAATQTHQGGATGRNTGTFNAGGASKFANIEKLA